MTNENIKAEVNYICGAVEFHAPQIKAFISSMDLPSLIACNGYIGGVIEAQLEDLVGATASIVETTREVIFPEMAKQDDEPLKPGEVRMYYPVGARPEREFDKGSRLVQ